MMSPFTAIAFFIVIGLLQR